MTGPWIRKWLGIHPARSLPPIAKRTFADWYGSRDAKNSSQTERTVILFCDEFTNYLEPSVGIAATELLEHLGYHVRWLPHPESGRASLSKGLVRQAQELAEANVRLFQKHVNEDSPLVGLEPSALLTFRDEYPDLVNGSLRPAANSISRHTYLIDEFLAQLIMQNELTADLFTRTEAKVLVHGHCHQKALSSLAATFQILNLPSNYQVEMLKTGCCGMAGSFGMESEHYDLSMQIGELILFPAIRDAPNAMIAAPGISCRHQILDGTGRMAKHPVELLRDALNSD